MQTVLASLLFGMFVVTGGATIVLGLYLFGII